MVKIIPNIIVTYFNLASAHTDPFSSTFQGPCCSSYITVPVSCIQTSKASWANFTKLSKSMCQKVDCKKTWACYSVQGAESEMYQLAIHFVTCVHTSRASINHRRRWGGCDRGGVKDEGMAEHKAQERKGFAGWGLGIERWNATVVKRI